MSEGEHGANDAGEHPVGALLEGVQLGANVGMDLARERAREAMFGLRTAEVRVDRFVLEREVGEGGMGVVYAAHDPSLDRRVAVKLVHASRSEGTRGERARVRMVAEARALAQVNHPNVVEVYEVGLHRASAAEGDEQVFVAMEFIEGQTVRQWLAATPRDPGEIIEVYRAAGQGLVAVHDEGLVHRDFKPDNVMVGDDGRIRVMDFGLARGLAEDMPSASGLESPTAYESVTDTGDVLGTPAYMAPEQFGGAPADPRSDQYSFCVALYEAIWGGRPMVPLEGEPGPNPPRKPLSGRRRDAVLRGLSREPQQRFSSMRDLLDALRPPRSKRWALLGGAAVIGTAGLAWALSQEPAPDSPCARSEQSFEETWNDARAQRVRGAFAEAAPTGAERATQVVARLDAYAQGWIEGHTNACEAALVERTDSDAVFDKRMRCLDRRKQRVAALVEVFAGADAGVVARAEDAVDALRPVDRCADPAFLEAMTEPPADPATAKEVEEIDRALAEVRALRDTGRVDEARARVEPLSARASAIDYPPIAAQVALAHGELEFRVGDAQAAKPLYEQAYFQAKDAGDATTAIWAAVSLAMSQATFANEHESANHWLRLARTEIEASKIDGWEVRLLDIELALLDSQGDFDGALKVAQERAERLGSECSGDVDCVRVAEAQSDLAMAHSRLGRKDEAIEHARKGLALARAHHGSQHPRVAEMMSTLGDVLLQAGRAKEASEMLGEALEIRERLLEPDAASLQMTRLLFANSLVEQGRIAEGLEQMLAVRASMGEGAGALITANIDNQIAWAQQSLGRFDEARRTFMGAVESMRELYPQGHPSMSIMLSNVAGIDRDTGNYAAALEGFTEAMTMRQQTVEGTDPLRATFLLNIAESLAKLGRNDEAIERYGEAVALTKEGALDIVALRVRLRLAELLAEREPKRAEALVEDGRRRCGALSDAQKEAARCHLAEMWPDKPAETP